MNTKGEITHYTLQHSFHLALHIRDKELIENIQKMLGNIGLIYEYITRNEVHFSVAKQKELL
jgi:isocitrate lyase